MEDTGLGFFCKPKFEIEGNNNGKNIIYTKEFGEIKIYIRADSLFIIDLLTEEKIKDPSKKILKKFNIHTYYTQYANVIYLLFKNSYDKIVKKKQLTVSPIILYEIVGDESIMVEKKNETWEINSMKGDAYGRVSYNAACWFHSSYNTIDKESFNEVIEEFDKSLDKIIENKNALQIILLLQKSYIALINVQCDVSILLSWTVIERIINNMFDDILDNTVTKGRKKYISGIKEYTASVKTNELVINGMISNELANKTDDVRKNRNKIMHGDYNLFDTTGKINGQYIKIMPLVLKGIEVAYEYIELYYDLKINIENQINAQIY